MDELITRYLQGKATPEEDAALKKWRLASPANEGHFQDVAAVWRATTPRGTNHSRPTATQLINAARGHHRHARTLRRAALAAMLLLGIALGHFVPTQGTHPALGVGEFVTGATEMATARLSDGSVVRLAPRSRLRVVEESDIREVWLDGKAFFSVAASEDRPFRVRTRAGDAHVLGTRFEVEVRDEGLRVVVVEGRVDVGADEARVALTAGQVARSYAGSAPSVIDHGNVAGLVNWTGAFLAFESTPLDRVAEELERRFDIEVKIVDESLGSRTITAWFGEQEVEEVIAVICRIADAHCSISDGVATIEP